MFRAIAFASLLLVSPVAAQTCSVMETQKLIPDGAQSSSNYGFDVDVAGDVLVIGRPRYDEPAMFSQSGSAEIYERIAGSWQRTAVLKADVPSSSAQFGNAVATDGTVILVAASAETLTVDGIEYGQAGSIYVFEKIAGTWTSTQQLTANELAGGGKQFGHSMDLDGNMLVVGEWRANYLPDSDSEAGAVHVFSRSGNSFSHEVKLQVPEASFRAHLGNSIATDDGIIVAGAHLENGGGSRSGAAYVFGFDDGWVLLDKLQAPAPVTLGDFGWSCDIVDGTIIVGGLDYFVTGGQGSAFAYELASPGNWDLVQQFNGTTTAGSDNFGYSTHFVDHETLLVGAILDDDGGPQTGSAFLFKKIAGVWTQEGGAFGNADRAAGDQFGISAASDGSTLVIPATGNDDGAPQNGSVHVFDLVCTLPCPGDIADDFGTIGADGMVSFGDFLALLGLIGPCPGGTPGCVGDIADDFGTLNGGDGMVSFGDFLALLGLIGPCP